MRLHRVSESGSYWNDTSPGVVQVGHRQSELHRGRVEGSTTETGSRNLTPTPRTADPNNQTTPHSYDRECGCVMCVQHEASLRARAKREAF